MRTGLNSQILTAGRISVTLVPDLGGRVVSLVDLATGREWLWRNTRSPLGPVRPSADYDDVWQGGFEELFPSDAQTTLNGIEYPDHGELWSTPWTLVGCSESSVSMSTVGPATGVEVLKSVGVSDATMQVHYELRNVGDTELPGLFKLHPAFDVNEHCRLDLPGGVVEKVEPGFGNLVTSLDVEPWPTAADLSRCRSQSSATNEFVYVSDLPEGRCGITDIRSGSSVRLEYSREHFPYCWLFMTYGGWRGHNVVVLEPCTNYPKDLAGAIDRGTHMVLRPGKTKEYDVTVTVGDAR